MAFTDLHEGILEAFADAQAVAHGRMIQRIEDRRWHCITKSMEGAAARKKAGARKRRAERLSRLRRFERETERVTIADRRARMITARVCACAICFTRGTHGVVAPIGRGALVCLRCAKRRGLLGT